VYKSVCRLLDVQLETDPETLLETDPETVLETLVTLSRSRKVTGSHMNLMDKNLYAPL
jgi:hypothetical protein